MPRRNALMARMEEQALRYAHAARLLEIGFCTDIATIALGRLGSGSSRIAAYDLGLDFVGCELDPIYYKLEEERFSKHSQQLNLFID